MDSLDQLEKEVMESIAPAIRLHIEKLHDQIEYLRDNPPCCGCDRVDPDSYCDGCDRPEEEEVDKFKAMYRDLRESFAELLQFHPIELAKLRDTVQYIEAREEIPANERSRL